MTLLPRWFQAAGLALLTAMLPAAAQSTNLIAPGVVEPAKEPKKVTWKTFEWKLVDRPFVATYSRKGLEIETPKGGYTAHIQWRLQPRFSYPYDSDPRRPSQFATEDERWAMRRARYKMDGEVLNGFISYKYEQDLVGGQMIDLYADINVKPWLRLRFGQWKSVFSQERYISSGRQQFVERSIVNREFTLDRQAGVSMHGRVAAGTRGDSMYFLEILNGTGMNSGLSGDGSPLVVARYQWNFLKADPGVASSDIGSRTVPAAFIALGAARNTSAFTRYSSSGGGQLDGFSAGTADRYRLNQLNAEFMFKYRGLSVQNENHWKQVRDNASQTTRTLTGGYVQAGYFPHNLWSAVPGELEFAYRFALVDPNTRAGGDLHTEHSLAMNVFLEGHDNKWTFAVSSLRLGQGGLPPVSGQRYQLQYDVQF
jgi:hypothetical protein